MIINPTTSFKASPRANSIQTTFGNIALNTNASANFFQGALVLSAAYSRALSPSEVGTLIADIRNDLVSTGRKVYLPMSYSGTFSLDYQPQPLAAYSVHRLRTNYSGPILSVTKSSGGPPQDIAPDGNGNITGALQSACAVVTCWVTTWYDQSGNGYNLQQTASADAPVIVNAGIIQKDNSGNPTLTFSGAQWMETGTALFTFISDSASVHAVASNTGTFANGGALALVANNYSDGLGVAASDMATGLLMGITSSGQVNAYRYGLGQAMLAPASSGVFFSASSVYDSYTHRMYVDGVSAQPVHNGGTYSAGQNHPDEFYSYDFVVGWDKDGTGGGSNDIHWKGNISEVLLYDYAITDTTAAFLQSYDAAFFGTGR